MNDDLDITAGTIYGEARGEGILGMDAVANVISNRVAIAIDHVIKYDKPHPLFGDGTFKDCCQRPEQFSCWNKDDPNLPIILDLPPDSGIAAQMAYNAAAAALDGTLVDNTNGATHYYATSLSEPPYWAKGKVPCATIGRQVFFKL